MKRKKIYTAALLISLTFTITRQAAGEQIPAIRGWPLHNLKHLIHGDKIPEWLGNDPVLGRLMCPPVSRYNLAKHRSEGLFFQSVRLSEATDGHYHWTFHTRRGLFWWDESEVTPSDLGHFIATHLADLVASHSSKLWQVPEFSWSVKGSELILDWKTPPKFGPWILNGLSFYRPVKTTEHAKLHWECAGIYKGTVSQDGFLLEPSRPYAQANRSVLVMTGDTQGANTRIKTHYDFTMAETLPTNPSVRAPDQAPTCKNLIPIPYLTLISWNSDQPKLKVAEIRQILTGLTPRGALLRAGAGFYGELLSSVIPRNHPAYQNNAWVREFSLKNSSESLNKMGYTRPRGDSLRQNSQQEALTLTLASVREETGILEKVIADSFLAVGIRTHFISATSGTKAEKADGIVTGILLDWPSLNFLPDFHSKAVKNFPFWSPEDPQLDQQLENYALSLTWGQPDFQALGKIHKLLYISEPVTVIMQHKICLSGPGDPSYKIDEKDPDWFRNILL